MTSVPLNGAFTDPSAVPVPDLRGIGAPPGRDGKNVRFQKTATHIQWAYVGSEDWIDLVAIEEVSGEDGDQVSLRTTETYIQWRLGEGDWTNLVAVDDLIGPVPVLGLGTVTTGDPGTEVEVSLLPNEQGIYLFNFTIPRGEGNVYGPGESAIGELPLFGGVDGKVLARSNVIVTAFILSLLGAADETSALAALGAAPVNSPELDGQPKAPTATVGDNSTLIATTEFVQSAIAALVASSPAALDTLNELAAALGNDPNFATTLTNALAQKAPLASPSLTGSPTAPTPPPENASTLVATTAFVAAAVAAVALIKATGAEVRAGSDNSKYLTAKALADSSAFVSSTGSGTWAPDLGSSYNTERVANGPSTLGLPTGMIQGRTYALKLKQDASGSRSWAFNACWGFGAAGTPTTSTGAGKEDFVFALCTDATPGAPKFRATFSKATSA